ERLTLPAVAKLAELQEHGACVGLVGQIGEGLAEPGDHRRALEPEEGVDLFLETEVRDEGSVRILALDASKQGLGAGVVGLAIERKAQVVLDVVVAWIDACGVGEAGELI